MSGGDLNVSAPVRRPAPPAVSFHLLTNRWEVIDPRFGMPPGCPVELDLGCGKGGLSLAMAERFPERMVLACDVMLGRLRRLANKAQRLGLANCAILRANSLDLVAYQLPPASVQRIHVVCPDPWPKNRHRARRLVTTDFLRRAARVLVPGGILHLATDDDDYRRFMLAAVEKLPEFRRDASGEALADIADLRSEFEKKWHAEGKNVPHFAYRRCTTTPC